MKLFYLLVLILIFSARCDNTNKLHISKGILFIIKIDTLSDYYVFNTRSSSDTDIIILAEKDLIKDCFPLRKSILMDSVKLTTMVKSGSRYDIIQSNGLTINGIKIKKTGELAKIITNCESFTDRK